MQSGLLAIAFGYSTAALSASSGALFSSGVSFNSGALASSSASADLVSSAAPERIKFTDKQSRTAREVIQRLSRNHYADIEFSDALSSSLLDQYLINLDPGKSFFTQQDISEFEPYRFTLDDHLQSGDLSQGNVIFSRYQKRLTDRLEKNLKQLPILVANFDYGKKDSLETDREELPWPLNDREADRLWYLRIKASALNLRLADKTNEEIIEVLSKRFNSQILRLQQMKSQDVFQVFLNSLTQLYDPHTSYLSPRNTENFNINMSLSLEGIGAVLQREEEYTKVVRLVPAGPADKHGVLQPADRIVGVGQGDTGELVDVVGWRLDEVVDMIRGRKGTKVRLELIPASAAADDSRKIVTIVRNKVKLEEQSAQKNVIEIERDGELTKIGVIDIPTFYLDFEARRRRDPNYKSTTTDVIKLINELEAEGVAGIVIDLRDNGGGSLYEANSLTRLFIDSGPVVQIRHANSRVDREPRPSYRSAHYTGPLAVLINRLSASASEIFAAAIQDYDRGIVLGGRSFGKGTVQSFTELTEGHLKLTESKFYRVSGGSTQHRGVIPDIQFPEVYDHDQVGESALKHALSWDEIREYQHSHYHPIEENLPALKQLHMARASVDPDFDFMRKQIELLAESRSRTRVSLNEAQRRQQREDDKAKQLNLENTRRKLKGLEPLKELEDEETETETAVRTDAPSADNDRSKALDAVKAQEIKAKEEQDKKDADDKVTEEDEPDPFLVEAGEILIDSAPLFDKVISSKNIPTQRTLR